MASPSGSRWIPQPQLVVRFHRKNHEAFVRLRAPLVPLAFLVFLFVWAIRPTPFAFTGAVFTGSVLLFTLAWTVSMALHTSTRRRLRFTALQVGDHLEEDLHIENRSILPVVYAEFIDHSGMPGYSAHGVRAAGPRTAEHWRLHTTCTQRGVYPLGHWEVRLSDPLGVFEAHQVYRHDLEITVCPPLATLPMRRISHRRTLGDRLTLRQPLPAHTLNAMSTRPYALGDPASRIHWRTSARQGDLYVRLFDPEASSVTWLVLDLDRTAHVGEGNEGSLEKMIIAGASLASLLLAEQLAVGMLLDGEQPVVVPPRPGREHLWTILRALAATKPGESPLAAALAHAASIASVRDSVAVITPSLEPAWLEKLAALSAGALGGLEVWLLDPASFGGHIEATDMARHLGERGIPTQVLLQSNIRPVLGAYDRLRRWEFRTLATGRVLLHQTPRPAPADA